MMFVFYLCHLYLFTYTGVDDVHVLFVICIYLHILELMMFVFYLCHLYLFTYTGVDDVRVLFMLFVFIYIYWS